MRATVKLFALCVCGWLTASSFARSDEAKAQRLTKEAIDLPSNEVEKKIELYTKAIEEDSRFYMPYTNRAVCYLNYGLWDEAINDATQAVSLAPENPHPWGIRGRAYAGKREFDKAFADLTRALELASTEEQSRNLYNDRGNAYFSNRQYDRAQKDYQQAVQIDKSFAKGWNNLGSTFRALGQYDEAFINLDRAIKNDPKAVRSYVNRGRVFVARNDKVMAQKDLNQAVELDLNDAPALIDRGMFSYTVGDIQTARADFVAAMIKQPENPYGAIWRYVATANLGLRDDARVHLQQYVKARKETDFWPMPIIFMLLGQQDAEAVLKAARRVDGELYIKERLAEAYYFLAQNALLDGDRTAHQDYLKKSVSQKVPRVQEYVMSTISLEGWKTPEPPPPRAVPADTSVQLK